LRAVRRLVQDLWVLSEPRVIILNGGSSSGKSSLARALQDVLPEIWLRLGVDDLINAAPPRLLRPGGLDLSDDGQVAVGPDFTAVEEHWMAGIAAIAAHGGHVIVEDNFISGPAAQNRWASALSEVDIRWVGVRCAPEIAATREATRGDRPPGMAAKQADAVHHGIHYDLIVDTSSTPAAELAEHIRETFLNA
jgi:chloramphenicol 3-O phosphotransferase